MNESDGAHGDGHMAMRTIAHGVLLGHAAYPILLVASAPSGRVEDVALH